MLDVPDDDKPALRIAYRRLWPKVEGSRVNFMNNGEPCRFPIIEADVRAWLFARHLKLDTVEEVAAGRGGPSVRGGRTDERVERAGWWQFGVAVDAMLAEASA